VIKPTVGSSDTGFASHIGQFDSLVDTIGNERSASLTLDDPLIDEDYDDIGISFGASVLQLLKTRHNCHKYVSTITHCQTLVANEGIFSGPGKTDEYSNKVGNLSFLMSNQRDCQSIPPPSTLGKTLEKLMENGIIFTDKQRRKYCSKKSDALRGWSLSDFWEMTSWPRDSAGTGTVRYGLPVRDDISDDDGEFMLLESPYRKQQTAIQPEEEYDEIGQFDGKPSKESSSPRNRAIQNNPYVLNVLGVEGLQSEIVETKSDSVVFMSAKFCKTCRSINPLYTRMARLNQENDSSTISFVKAEASGPMGKELGRHLSVRAVPAFVLFRNGEKFGIPLSVSKLPSRKLDKALELLSSGADWDDSILDEEDDKSAS
jgi:thiol-disulfide isomerase/thioredoxin